MQITWKDRTKTGQKPTTIAKRRKARAIPPGQCGWPGCTEPRRNGKWEDGGSYMCERHAERLLPVRALFDKDSPDAVTMRKQIHAEAELAKLIAEEREEEEQAA